MNSNSVAPALKPKIMVNRGHAAMRTWVASLVWTVSTMILGFIVTPIILSALGDVRFGLSRTLTEVFAYLVLVGQGITLALVPRLARAAGQGDRGLLNRCLSVVYASTRWQLVA